MHRSHTRSGSRETLTHTLNQRFFAQIDLDEVENKSRIFGEALFNEICDRAEGLDIPPGATFLTITLALRASLAIFTARMAHGIARGYDDDEVLDVAEDLLAFVFEPDLKQLRQILFNPQFVPSLRRKADEATVATD